MSVANGGGHIGVPVSDIRVSQAFYQDLGFQVLEQHELAVEGGVNYITFMRHGGLTIELYQLHGDAVAARSGAIDHFAVQVDDLAAMRSRLDELGLPLIAGPERLPFGENGVTYMMVNGPDQEKIEFDYFH